MRKFFLLISMFLLTGVFLQAQTVDVTFQVNMRIQALNGYFDPGTEVVRTAGSFQGWDPASAIDMDDSDQDSIYVITLQIDQNQTIEYKFLIGTAWGKDELQGQPNRSLVIATSNITVDPAYFNELGNYSGIPSTLTFKVDMRGPLRSDMELTDHVYLAGGFTDWGTSAIEMTGPDPDSVYTAADVDFTSGDLAAYKFVWSAGAVGDGHWETIEATDFDAISNYPNPGDINRGWGIHDGSNEISRLWENDDPNASQLADGNIFFEVDMSVLTELGVFDPNVDSVQIRGAFNGWNGNDFEKSHMSQNAAEPNRWTIEIPFLQTALNSNQAYKFFIDNADTLNIYSNTGWEVPIRTTYGDTRNRGVFFQGDPLQEAPYSWFENINPDWVIESGTTVEIHFMVDMTNATNPDSQTVPFVPGTDSVFWLPRLPLYYAVNNIPWPGDYPRVLELTDPNSDMIYTGTMIIDGPMFNGFLYDYGYSSTSGLIIEGGGQGFARVRFVGQSGGPRTFDSPWDMPLDVWSNSEKPEEDHPEGWIDNVREIPGNPQTYSLEQNYPNPFNPSTTIRFSVPEQGLVSLKVFNLLGEQVATLINSELAKGSYQINFKGANFSSGIYFYTLNAGNFVSTKKMILLK